MSVHQFRSKHGDASDGALGGRLTRIDGDAKIRGEATYALENHPENLCHVVLVGSTKASGRVVRIDIAAAHGALAMSTPGDTSMATLPEVLKLAQGGDAKVQR